MAVTKTTPFPKVQGEGKFLDKTTLITVLTWYRLNKDVTSLRPKFDKKYDKHLQGVSFDYVHNYSLLALFDLLSNGYTIEVYREDLNTAILKAIEASPKVSSSRTLVKKESPKSSAKPFVKSLTLGYIDNNIDNILFHRNCWRIDAMTSLDVSLTELKAHLELVTKEIQTAFDEKSINKSAYDAAHIFLNSFKNQYVKRKISKRVPLSQVVKNVKYSKDKVGAYKTYLPTQVVGKKKLYTYDTETRRITCYVTNSDEGLTFKGTTLQNFDIEKSFYRLVSYPDKFFSAIADSKLSTLNSAYAKIKQKDKIPSGRFTDSTVILLVS